MSWLELQMRIAPDCRRVSPDGADSSVRCRTYLADSVRSGEAAASAAGLACLQGWRTRRQVWLLNILDYDLGQFYEPRREIRTTVIFSTNNAAVKKPGNHKPSYPKECKTPDSIRQRGRLPTRFAFGADARSRASHSESADSSKTARCYQSSGSGAAQSRV